MSVSRKLVQVTAVVMMGALALFGVQTPAHAAPLGDCENDETRNYCDIDSGGCELGGSYYDEGAQSWMFFCYHATAQLCVNQEWVGVEDGGCHYEPEATWAGDCVDDYSSNCWHVVGRP